MTAGLDAADDEIDLIGTEDCPEAASLRDRGAHSHVGPHARDRVLEHFGVHELGGAREEIRYQPMSSMPHPAAKAACRPPATRIDRNLWHLYGGLMRELAEGMGFEPTVGL